MLGGTSVSLAVSEMSAIQKHSSGPRHELPQDIRQDAAMLVIIDLDRGIDPARHRDLFLRSAGPGNFQGQVLLRPQFRTKSDHVKFLAAVQMQWGRPFLELQRQYSHAHKV